MCTENAEIAGSVGRLDLVQVWTLAGLIAASYQSNDSDEDAPWTHHPFFKSQIEYLYAYLRNYSCINIKITLFIYFNFRILHYAKMSDIQTAAMLCCVFTKKPEHKGNFSKNVNSNSVAATVSLIIGFFFFLSRLLA